MFEGVSWLFERYYRHLYANYIKDEARLRSLQNVYVIVSVFEVLLLVGIYVGAFTGIERVIGL